MEEEEQHRAARRHHHHHHHHHHHQNKRKNSYLFHDPRNGPARAAKRPQAAAARERSAPPVGDEVFPEPVVVGRRERPRVRVDVDRRERDARAARVADKVPSLEAVVEPGVGRRVRRQVRSVPFLSRRDQVVAVEALDEGGHLGDPGAQDRAGGQVQLGLEAVIGVRLVHQLPGQDGRVLVKRERGRERGGGGGGRGREGEERERVGEGERRRRRGGKGGEGERGEQERKRERKRRERKKEREERERKRREREKEREEREREKRG